MGPQFCIVAVVLNYQLHELGTCSVFRTTIPKSFALLREFLPRKNTARRSRNGGTIGSGAGDCAPAPSHTTGHAVFRIRRLNAAALHTVAARSDGIQNP